VRVVGVGVVAVLAGAMIVVPVEPVLAAGATDVCRIRDERLDELSGLVTTDGGYVAVNDGSDEPSHRRIFYVAKDGKDCKVTRTVKFPSKPDDTEDMALAPDGTLWIGDIGSNEAKRKTIGLWKLAPGADEPVLYKVSYPGDGHNAETLVLDGDGTPIIITKEPFAGELFVPTGPLSREKTTPLRSTGLVRISLTTTSNPHGIAGRAVLTGGTNSPDGTKVALRTYADAFEYEVKNGDVVSALTVGSPETVPLPDEPQGEAIAYTRDGTALVTASEATNPKIRRYASALKTVKPSPSKLPVPASDLVDRSHLAILGAGVGGGLALLLLILVLVIRRARR
jgi:hypothetical protein